MPLELNAIFPVLLAVVARLCAIVMTMPVMGSRMVPLRAKLAVVIAFTAIVAPSVTVTESEFSTWQLAIMLVNEVLIGCMMGLSFRVILTAAQVAGTVMESLSGFAIVPPAVSADEDTGSGGLTRLFAWTTIAVFIASGGLTQLLEGLLTSFDQMPPGNVVFSKPVVDFFVVAIGQSFEFGLRAAIPGIIALLAASAVLALAQKNLPQLGGMQIGLGIKSVSGILVTSLLLLSTPWVIMHSMDWTQEQLVQLFQSLSERV